jgi:dUTP pyrophosphatase
VKRLRGFEVIANYRGRGVELPMRKTHDSAGYDIATTENVCLQPGQLALIPTGLKAYMQPDEYLAIHIRSSLAIKHRLYLANSQGIIDSDYYDNPDNEGHILIGLVNGGSAEVMLPEGMRIAQGIFCRYLRADADEQAEKRERSGGIGSTGSAG